DAAAQYPGFRHAERQHGPGQGVLRSDVCPFRSGADRRRLSAGTASRMVPARSGTPGVGRIMSMITDFTANGIPIAHHRPWPRTVIAPDAWEALGGLLAQGRHSLLGLWGDAGFVHMAVLD